MPRLRERVGDEPLEKPCGPGERSGERSLHPGISDGLSGDRDPARHRLGVRIRLARREGVDVRLESAQRILAAARGRALRPVAGLLHQRIDEREQDLSLVVEVIVDEPGGHAGRAGDLGDRGANVAAP